MSLWSKLAINRMTRISKKKHSSFFKKIFTLENKIISYKDLQIL